MSARTADAVVVGGGIVGCATALFLARAGLRVHLVERHGIATGTSGCCQGHLMVTPDPPGSYRLTRASVRLWHELAAELDGFEFHPCGALWLAENEEDLSLLDKLLAELESHGDTAEIVPGERLRELEPGLAPDLPAAMFYEPDAVVMPMFAAGALLRDALARGAVVHTSTAVTGLLRDGERVCGVRTAAGDLHAGHVVLAAGVWTPEILAATGLERPPIYPRRGDLAITAHHSTPVRTQLLEVAYLRVSMSGGAEAGPTSAEPDPGTHAVNVQPQSNGSCLIGSTRQFQGTDLSRRVDRRLLHTSLTRAARYVPDLARAPVVRTWAGLRPYTIDKKPLLGPVPGVPGLHLCAGHEGLGITLAPISGRLVAQAVVGEEPEIDLAPYSVARFAEACG